MKNPSAWLCHQVKTHSAQEPGCPPSAVQSKPAGNGGACSQEPASLPVCREEGVLARVVCLQEQVDPRRVAPQGDLQSHCLEVVWCDSLSWDGGKETRVRFKYSCPGAGMK